MCGHRKLASACPHAVDTEAPCDSSMWNVPNIQALAAQPRTASALADFCIFGSPCKKWPLFLVGDVDSRHLHRIATKCAGTGERCSVSGQKHRNPKASASRSEFFALHVTTPALTQVAFRSRHDSHLERTTIPENISFECLESSLNA